MRLLSALLALLIAVSVVAAPLPGAVGVAHAGPAHAAHGAGEQVSEAACDGAQAHHAGHDAQAHAYDDLCAGAAGADDGLAQAGCCEMAMCHPFLFMRSVDAHRAPPVAIAAAWRVETRIDDERTARIERPPRA